MPLRTVVLKDGSERARSVVNTHPDGSEFLPEQLAVSSDTPEGERVLKALERLINITSETGGQ